jgi:hypothetical protein
MNSMVLVDAGDIFHIGVGDEVTLADGEWTYTFRTSEQLTSIQFDSVGGAPSCGSEPGEPTGNYYNPDPGEWYRPDLDHGDPIDPHWRTHPASSVFR